MVKVKICGLAEPVTLAVALDKGADMVGFNFYAASPRCISPQTAAVLGAQVSGRAAKVAVTVDADDALLEAIIETLAPDYIQAHGDETPARIRDIAHRHGIRVIKAIKVRDREDVARAKDYTDDAMILFDAKAPDDMDAALPGGNGISFEWSLLRGFRGADGFVLSGGLDASNVAMAAARTGAAIVDVSSGVETAPGVKDAAMIANFIEAARRGS
jgi:phosphoribosylanthranilate isomerase